MNAPLTPSSVSAPSPTASEPGSEDRALRNLGDSETLILAALERCARSGIDTGYHEAISEVMAVVSVNGTINLQGVATLLTGYGLGWTKERRISAALRAMPAKGEA